MLPNHSPWISQLRRTRPVTPLEEDLVADVVIVGGGIAGIMTAFFTLRDTDHSVLLLEADKVAHGATGHNAGQLATYFERSFATLVQEFGLALASDGQRAVEDAWMLLDEVLREARLTTPIHKFTGYAGVSTLPQLIEHLEDNRLRRLGGLTGERIIVSREWDGLSSIPAQFEGLYELAERDDVLVLLETRQEEYIAAIASAKGCANSALLSEEIVGYLLVTHPERFRIHEGTAVTTISLHENAATLTAGGKTIEASRVVLATNGFENFSIHNDHGTDINTSFHHDVRGRIGYMAGYLEPLATSATAISYYPRPKQVQIDPTGDPYFYLTRRPHEHEGSDAWSLVCAGGPDKVLPNLALYSRAHGCDEEMKEGIHDFLRKDYRLYSAESTEYEFCWHGLMGYTPNRVRRVGVEPHNKMLLYNLGCNGVGLLPSIMGGARIAKILGGVALFPSIFDPKPYSPESV